MREKCVTSSENRDVTELARKQLIARKVQEYKNVTCAAHTHRLATYTYTATDRPTDRRPTIPTLD
jgi:hypothetical protein